MTTDRHYSHLDYEKRRFIENSVVEGRSLAWMAAEIGVDATSISRELRRNRRADGATRSMCDRNDCVHRRTCAVRRICDPECRRKCSSCARMCRDGSCPSYEREACGRTSRAPWVCNGCPKKPRCPLPRYTYSAKAAQASADSRLRDAREGVNMTGLEMAELAATVKAGLAKGQSVHHVFASNPGLPCSERSFYRHVENEAIDIAKMDLRKKVKYKKRNRRRDRRESGFYDGRTYADYLQLPEEERARTVQMDCVEGVQGDARAFLTLHFVALRFQIYVLLERKDAAHVVAALDMLEGLCGGPEAFRRVFGLALTDRGSEFDDVAGIERGGRCRVFYADPMRSDQKGGCEKNHVELRKIVPKGTSIDGLGLDPWLVAGICSHANSSLRLSIGDACPMALARAALPAALLDGLGLDVVPPAEVDLTPGLVGRLKAERELLRGHS